MDIKDLTWRVIDMTVNEVMNSARNEGKTMRYKSGLKALVASAKYGLQQEFIAEKLSRSQSTVSEMITEQWRCMKQEDEALVDEVVTIIDLTIQKIKKRNENSRTNEHTGAGAVLG